MIGSTRYMAGVEIRRQSTLAAEIAKLQTSVTTNQRLSAASDDPAAAARIADIRQNQADNIVWTRNANVGASVASAADTTLTSVQTSLQRAKELIISGGNDTNANVDRAALATELRAIAEQIGTLRGSTDPNGQALFPETPPLAIPVSAGLSLTATTSGKQVFEGVKTDLGDRKMTDILTAAATALELPADGTIATTDANGDPITLTRDQAISASVSAITAADDHLAAARTDQGLRAQRFDDAKDRIASGTTDLKIERSSLEDTDTTTAIAEYQAKSLALQAAQTIFAQSHKSTLFDLLG